MRFLASASARGPLLALAAAIFLCLAGVAAHAQNNGYNQDQRADQGDPPSQAGRLSAVTGTVSIQPAGSDDWGQVQPNYPLGPGDRIFSDQDGRAEIQVGETYLRIGHYTDVTFINADANGLTFGIAQGTLHLRTFGLWQGQSVYVNTPSGSASLSQPGEIRVEAYPDRASAVFTNYASDVQLNGAAGFDQDLQGGQSLELIGTNPVYPQWLDSGDMDDLDNWSRGRDMQILNATSYRYVSPEIPGAQDLDTYGTWLPGTEYGAIWFPNNVPQGWQPYHNGHWVNRDPWGWIWVEDEPWGYAPFHYGRWVSFAGRWGWIPGAPAAHPVWSPALVVFAGGIHFGGGGVSAWFPLGPGEAYRPWYHTSPRYIDRINISNMQESRHVHIQNTYVNVVNVTNVTNITYINQNIGVTAMRHEDFASGRPAQQAAVRVDPRQFDHVQVLDRPEPRPTHQSFVPPVARPVPVAVLRPALINNQGKQVSLRPGAQPIEPPVRPVPPVRVIPGRTVVAPPPGVRTQPQPGTPGAPGFRPAPGQTQPMIPGNHPDNRGNQAPGTPQPYNPGNRPDNRGNTAPGTPQPYNPGYQPPLVHPGQPAQPPAQSPTPPQGFRPQPPVMPTPQPYPNQRPNPQPPANPGPNPYQRPTPPPPPNPNPPPYPNQRPAPPVNPAPQQPYQYQRPTPPPANPTPQPYQNQRPTPPPQPPPQQQYQRPTPPPQPPPQQYQRPTPPPPQQQPQPRPQVQPPPPRPAPPPPPRKDEKDKHDH